MRIVREEKKKLDRNNYGPRVKKNFSMKKLLFFISTGVGAAMLTLSPSARAHDWVDYGPLKVNIRGWELNQYRRRSTGSITYDTNFVHSRRNSEGLISVDCDRDRISLTDSKGKWRPYRISIRRNEKNLKNDFCTAIRKNPALFD